MDIQRFFDEGEQLFLPHLSIDIVIVGYQQDELKVLLLRFAKKWILPGGFIGRQESVDEAAERILKERTGLGQAHLKFLNVFGDKDRNFSGQWQEMFENAGFPWREDLWFNTRYVTLAYYALVNMEETETKAGIFFSQPAWHNLDNLPPLWMDHASIAAAAQERLKRDVSLEPVALNLLPRQFTMPELHQLHEKILQQKLERSRFQKKMLALGIFERLPKLKTDTPGRNPYLYRIKEEG